MEANGVEQYPCLRRSVSYPAVSIVACQAVRQRPESLLRPEANHRFRSQTDCRVRLWAYYGDSPSTVDWLIWSDPGPAEGGTLLDSAKDASLSNTFLLNNHNLVNGFKVYQSSFSLPSIALGPGTYWLELTNANDSMSDFIDWDANGGPSGAQSLYMGGPPLFGNLTLADNCGDSNLTPGFGGATLASCSESFEITGQSMPEAAQLALVLNAGLLLVVAALRRKLG